MYRSRDEAYMTQLRHRLMTNEGTPWLADRRAAYQYFQKYLQLDDLHLWATGQVPGVEVSEGTGVLNASIAIVTPRIASREESTLILDLLNKGGLGECHLYLTHLCRITDRQLLEATGASLDEMRLLRAELAIVGAPAVISFGVELTGEQIGMAGSTPVIRLKDSQVFLLPSIQEGDTAAQSNIQAVIQCIAQFLCLS